MLRRKSKKTLVSDSNSLKLFSEICVIALSTPFSLCLHRRMFLHNSFEQLKQFPYQLRPTKKTSQSDRTHQTHEVIIIHIVFY